MTFNEAKYAVEDLLNNACALCPDKSKLCHLKCPFHTAARIAEIALDKQTKEKPIKTVFEKRGYIPYMESYSCPNCRCVVAKTSFYCGNCGQKLDWEIKNDV